MTTSGICPSELVAGSQSSGTRSTQFGLSGVDRSGLFYLNILYTSFNFASYPLLPFHPHPPFCFCIFIHLTCVFKISENVSVISVLLFFIFAPNNSVSFSFFFSICLSFFLPLLFVTHESFIVLKHTLSPHCLLG